MTSYQLDKFLSGHVFAFTLIFARIGSMLMLFPGIGESYVPVRMRLMFAFSVTFLLTGPLSGRMPAPPATVPDFIQLITYEVLIGLFFGTILRLLLNALETAGTIVGLQSGLSNATVLNPAIAAQSTLPSALLSVVGVTLIFVSGLDHLLLSSFAHIYDVFPVGGAYMPGDMTQAVIRATADSFLLGIELASPFFVMGLLLYTALGLLQKLLPQIQLFLVALPIQIYGSLVLLGVTIAGIMTVWLHYVDDRVAGLILP